MTLLNGPSQASLIHAHPCDGIKAIITPREKDLGGFSVRRVLPSSEYKSVGPWVFFDHMGPAEFSPGQGINVRPHPHINMATVTYLFEGEIFHRDSLGSHQLITPGGINLMIAGRGIVHSERERPEVNQSSHKVHGLQLWLALPEDQEECAPAFYHYGPTSIPEIDQDGVNIRLMIGSAFGMSSPVKTLSDTLYLDIEMEKGQKITLPQAEERAFYIVGGSLMTENIKILRHDMAILSSGANVTLKALEKSRFVIIGGKSLGKRYIEWNFVSSSRDRIENAKKMWKEKKFPIIKDDSEDYIPLPE